MCGTYSQGILIASFMSMLTASVAAQSGSFEDCQKIGDRLARYACYDQVEGSTDAVAGEGNVAPARGDSREPEASSATSGTVASDNAEDGSPEAFNRRLPGVDARDAEDAAFTSTSAPLDEKRTNGQVENFGRNGTETARVEDGSNGKQELVDSIASLRLVQHNTWEITLDSGQVWRQMINRRYPLKAGDQIRLQSTGFGTSYRLSAERLAHEAFFLSTGLLSSNPVVPASQPGRDPTLAGSLRYEFSADSSRLPATFNNSGGAGKC